MTFDELKTQIAAYAHRDTLTARIPEYVKNAERMIGRRVRAIEMLSAWLSSLADADRVTANGAIYNLPADCLELVAVRGTYGSAQFKIRMLPFAELARHSTTGAPVYGAVNGRTLEFRGTPSSATTFPLCYFKRPAALTNANDVVLANCEDLYLHGSLYWLHLDAQDLDTAQTHKALFESEAEDAKRAASRLLKAGMVSTEAAPVWGGSGM